MSIKAFSMLQLVFKRSKKRFSIHQTIHLFPKYRIQIKSFQFRVGIVGNSVKNLVVWRDGNGNTSNIELQGFNLFPFPIENGNLVTIMLFVIFQTGFHCFSGI